jgi:hypothetical protein
MVEIISSFGFFSFMVRPALFYLDTSIVPNNTLKYWVRPTGIQPEGKKRRSGSTLSLVEGLTGRSNKNIIFDIIPKNAVESVPSSYAGEFFCSMPIHRRFLKSAR